MSRLSFGNANMPKICLESLVRLIVNMDDDDDVRWYLTELLDYDVVPLIATYIRSGECRKADMLFGSAARRNDTLFIG